jgi:hypothetical protein
MTNKQEIKEDVPVTTTNNAGAGLDSPQLPIKPQSVLSRFKKLKKSSNQKQ